VRLARAIPDGHVIATDIEPDMVRYMTDLRGAVTPHGCRGSFRADDVR
jgi:hypothetical protein